MKPNRCWSKDCPSARSPIERNLAETTIIGHLERMAGQGLILDLEHLLPSAEKLDNIRAAFDVCGSDLLRPVLGVPGHTMHLR